MSLRSQLTRQLAVLLAKNAVGTGRCPRKNGLVLTELDVQIATRNLCQLMDLDFNTVNDGADFDGDLMVTSRDLPINFGEGTLEALNGLAASIVFEISSIKKKKKKTSSDELLIEWYHSPSSARFRAEHRLVIAGRVNPDSDPTGLHASHFEAALKAVAKAKNPSTKKALSKKEKKQKKADIEERREKNVNCVNEMVEEKGSDSLKVPNRPFKAGLNLFVDEECGSFSTTAVMLLQSIVETEFVNVVRDCNIISTGVQLSKVTVERILTLKGLVVEEVPSRIDNPDYDADADEYIPEKGKKGKKTKGKKTKGKKTKGKKGKIPEGMVTNPLARKQIANNTAIPVAAKVIGRLCAKAGFTTVKKESIDLLRGLYNRFVQDISSSLLSASNNLTKSKSTSKVSFGAVFSSNYMILYLDEDWPEFAPKPKSKKSKKKASKKSKKEESDDDDEESDDDDDEDDDDEDDDEESDDDEDDDDDESSD